MTLVECCGEISYETSLRTGFLGWFLLCSGRPNILAGAYWIGNFDNGFWLIQKLDCSENMLKNPRILWSNLFVIETLGYNQLL